MGRAEVTEHRHGYQTNIDPERCMKNRLRDLRAQRKWTQAELASHLEVSRQTVNSLERGKYDPSLPLAFRIAEIFGTRIEEVFDPAVR
jgi:putative transcriptional regulator